MDNEQLEEDSVETILKELDLSNLSNLNKHEKSRRNSHHALFYNSQSASANIFKFKPSKKRKRNRSHSPVRTPTRSNGFLSGLNAFKLDKKRTPKTNGKSDNKSSKWNFNDLNPFSDFTNPVSLVPSVKLTAKMACDLIENVQKNTLPNIEETSDKVKDTLTDWDEEFSPNY